MPPTIISEIFEREYYVDSLSALFKQVQGGTGHTVFLMGEPGIGKTTLVNHFIKKIEGMAIVYSGSCDSLFTPRPLGPLFDIAPDIDKEFADVLRKQHSRSEIFAALVKKFSLQEGPVILVFEDIHWADEATLDFIKFFARRVNRYRCLFVLTCRDDEANTKYLSPIFGELPDSNFSKMTITTFTRDMVDKLAARKGSLSGRQLFELTGGNPFYVMQIIQYGDSSVPERIKDSILTLYNSRNAETKAAWEFLSILPSSRIELSIAHKIENDFERCIDECIAHGVIVSHAGHLSFKHELFRIAIEETLSPTRRVSLHKKMLAIINDSPPGTVNLAQVVHHARCANERSLVSKIAPAAADEAVLAGARREAAKLLATAIEYADPTDPSLCELYERHAYECYLTYQIPVAIQQQEKALEIWRSRGAMAKVGDMLRFMSRLWWYAGNQENAIRYALQSIEILKSLGPSTEMALSYSNYSQINMLAEDHEAALKWGYEAVDLAIRFNHKEIEAHALNNVGNTLLKIPSSAEEGERLMEKSLSYSLEYGLQEHAARAYANLLSSFIYAKSYSKALEVFDAGFTYCDERDLDFIKHHLVSGKARMFLELGRWDEAERLAKQSPPDSPYTLVKIGSMLTMARLHMRRGQFDEAARLIDYVKVIAMPTREPQRIVPVLTALMELSWISGCDLPRDEISAVEQNLFPAREDSWFYSDLAYWMRKCGVPRKHTSVTHFAGPYRHELEGNWKEAASSWKELGCPYEQALALMDGDKRHQVQGIQLIESLGATATLNMLRRLQTRKIQGRGLNRTTVKNPAQLTDRQIQILELLEGGAQNKEIASRLSISPKTVDHHLVAIFSRLEVNNRAKAVSEARRLGIIK